MYRWTLGQLYAMLDARKERMAETDEEESYSHPSELKMWFKKWGQVG